MSASHRGRAVVGILAAALLLTGLVGCSSGDDPYPADDPGWVIAQEQHLLDQRARAIRTDDLALFLKGVARGDKAFLARQRRYFANLTQLPLAKFRYTVLTGSWPARLADPGWGPAVRMPRVRQVIQLDGYDAAPVRRTIGFAFAVRAGELRIISDRTGQDGFFPGYEPDPWDLTAIQVRHDGDVLGVFDSGTVSEADQLLAVVADGVQDVQAGLPFSWLGRVVVYSFDDRRVLNSFNGVPGGNIRHLGALTFPVYADSTGKHTVGMRFTLLPSSLHAGQPFLGRIVRHELTHVAVGPRDDGAPVWFAEGLAEYMGARPLPRDERRIASVAITRARGPVDAMPASATFNGPDQDWHYALSWMACDYIAAAQGEAKLWELMAALSNGGTGTRDADQDVVLRRVLGFDSHELARRAAARIRSIYG